MSPAPETLPVPRHVAIVMDGNGRWAQRRHRPRTFGHQAGQKALRQVVERAGRRGVGILTVFAFSSENWNRPRAEVMRLMELFVGALDKEVREIDENGIRLRFIGGREAFADGLQQRMRQAEHLTRDNDRMLLNVAVNYGGRWDITEAARALAQEAADGRLDPRELTREDLAARLSMAGTPDPDLFIRTGGEQRLSNFLLWQSAYAELYFTDTLWPDFDGDAFDEALRAYARRERRFGEVRATGTGDA